jgi:transcriptional regulator with XRE-family HTH domain
MVMSDPAMIGRAGRKPRSRPLLRAMIGDVLRRTRLEQGRTLADVARIARVSMPYLSELERGRKEASSEVLAAICEALRIELSDLLAEVGHDLVFYRARRPAIVQLDSVRDRGDRARLDDPGDGQSDRADVLRGPGVTVQDPGHAMRTPGDVRCLPAA